MIVRVRRRASTHLLDTSDEAYTLCGKHVRDVKRVPGWVPVTCEACERAATLRYAFCEAVTASTMTRIHIRILSGRGLRPGGGADTPSLCGKVVSWDLPGAVSVETAAADSRGCPTCIGILRQSS